MGYFDDYLARLSITDNSMQSVVENNLTDSPGYIEVEINDIKTDAIISANDNGTYKIITKVADTIGCGDIVEFNSQTFIIISPTKVNNSMYNTGTMRLCNLVPFYFKTYDTVQRTCGYYEKLISIDTSLDEAINLPDDTVMITIPDNAYTALMKKGDDFFIFADGWYEKYEVSGLDKSTNGLIKIKALETQANETPTEFYNLSPTSTIIGSVVVVPNSLTIIVGNNKQLSVTVYDPSGVAMSGELVTWSSSNTAVAVVSTTGYVIPQSCGECLITAKSDSDGTIVGTCAVEVSDDGGWYT